jgi:hypothetical protein
VGCVLGTLLSPPDDEEVLKRFYYRTRPWGCWGPIRAKVAREHPDLVANRQFGRDLMNVVVGIVWQTALTATGIYLVLQNYSALAVCVGLVLVTSLILKFMWYDRLQDYPPDLEAATVAVAPRS